MNKKREVKLLNKINRLLKQIGCPRFLHHYGPKKYQLKHHLFALIVMTICKFSLRRAEQFLKLLGFKTPTYSALCKARKRIPMWIWNSLLQLTAGIRHDNVAVDSTGFSRNNPSHHYIYRIDRKKPVKSYIKLSSFFDLDKKKFLALRIRAKPRHDIKDVKYLLKKYSSMKKLFGDSAYDAEFLHECCYDNNIQTLIKPRKNARKGFYRKKQMKFYSDDEYHRRSLIESGQGGVKRRYGGYTLSRNINSAKAELYCKGISYNLKLFY